ncbi:hypothetical protein K431DRAFT_129229 [Polychaeton citri CBS 116435]|uniref:Rhodopsin domain-containing protein n=1 Tax=Polychaeton citri CBS 116435 TaxID=1314669 RepID=A0A9P4Q5Z6_9PEZI|nr:hypothetical protein K431DRAFT_129229 [Polychaeton citri CBS 116435]
MATTAGASSPTPRIRLNDSDHGAAVIIAAGIMLGTTVIALTLRLHQRWPWTRMLKLEDVMLLIATIFDIANVAAVALAVQYGLGQHSHSLTSHRIDKTRQALIASFTVSFLTEGFAAISSFALLRSMTPNKMYRRLMTGLVAVVAAWSLAGLLRFAVASSTGNLEIASWIGFGVVNMLIQLALFASAMWTIWPLQMAVSKKMGVSLWFSLCLPSNRNPPCIYPSPNVRFRLHLERHQHGHNIPSGIQSRNHQRGIS